MYTNCVISAGQPSAIKEGKPTVAHLITQLLRYCRGRNMI